MRKNNNKPSYECSLLPHEVEPVLSIQQAKQQTGWGITAFELPKVWMEVGQGEGVTIAVLDTGCDLTHPDLDDNLIVVEKANLIKPRKAPWDDNGHGTHVAGIIAAENNDIGMVGVAPKSKIMPIKVLDEEGNGDLTNTAKGIRLAIDNNADIIAMSLGAPVPLRQVRQAIKLAAKKGIPCFVAAGNAGKTKNVFYPAAYPETIAIGSIDKDFRRSNFSNTGKNLDFLAPGGKIFSTVPDNWYAIMSGTSMACPFAIGVAALALSYKIKNKLNTPLETVEDYRKLFRSHTIPVNNPNYAGKKFFEGFGIINPREFVKKL